MKHFLTFISVVLLPLVCVGAPSYTTYFNNTHTYTNASVAGTARVNSLVVTNGISSAANWTASGTTNSTLPGVASADGFVATNGVTSLTPDGTFVGNPTDSAVWWGGSSFDALTYIDFASEATEPAGREMYIGSYSAADVTTTGWYQLWTYTSRAALSLRILTNGTGTAWAEFGTDLVSPFLAFGTTTKDTYLRRDAANTLAMRNGTAAQTLNVCNTFTDASNYELGSIRWNANVFEVGSYKLGSGSSRRVQFVQGGTNVLYISESTGALLWNSDNTRDIGATGANRPKNVFAGGTVNAANQILGQNGVFAGGSGGNVGVKGPSSGVMTVVDSSETSFNRLQFGGTSSSFPALKRSSTELQVRFADDSADAPLKSGQLSNTGIRVMTPSSLQTLAAGNALLANATKVRVVGSGGAVTLTSTPTIADGSDGQYVMIQGTDDTNTLTVQDQGSLASSNLELGAATRVLGAGDVLVLTFDTTASVWYEVSFANN